MQSCLLLAADLEAARPAQQLRRARPPGPELVRPIPGVLEVEVRPRCAAFAAAAVSTFAFAFAFAFTAAAAAAAAFSSHQALPACSPDFASASTPVSAFRCPDLLRLLRLLCRLRGARALEQERAHLVRVAAKQLVFQRLQHRQRHLQHPRPPAHQQSVPDSLQQVWRQGAGVQRHEPVGGEEVHGQMDAFQVRVRAWQVVRSQPVELEGEVLHARQAVAPHLLHGRGLQQPAQAPEGGGLARH
jgi:hypothetical protein